MMDKKSSMSLLTVLALIFITLKLCNVIAWSWWVVLAPLYVGIATIFSIFLVYLVGGYMVIIIKHTFKSIFNRTT